MKTHARKKTTARTAAIPLQKHDDVAWQSERLDSLLSKFDNEKRSDIMRSLQFARDRHASQERHGGAPYVVHPIRLANILVGEWKVTDPDVVSASLLHDIIEDTETSVKDVKAAFGPEVGTLVDGMTMWKGSETYESYVRRIAKGPRELRLIKCADVLDNLRSWRTCVNESNEKFPRWWHQANDYILPMAKETYAPAAKSIKTLLNDAWYLKHAHIS